jgi:hypothetical protein
MAMRTLGLFVVLTLSGCSAPGEQLHHEVSSAGFLSRIVLTDERQLTTERLVARARRFMAEVSGTRSFAQLVLVRTPPEAAVVLSAGQTDIDFE